MPITRRRSRLQLHRHPVLAGLGLLLAGTNAVPAAAAPVLVTGDPVLYWNEVLMTGLSGSPTVQSRSYAMVSVAMFDAVNATLGSPNRAYLSGIANAGGDTRAAASVAAHDVLVHLNPARAAEFGAALANSLALVPDGAAKSNGIATGAAYAAAMIAGRSADGSTAVVPYTPSGLPGHWAPTPGVTTPAVPQYANVAPWLMGSPSQFRAGPPPAITSAEYAVAYNEVMAIGSATSTIRTADQTAAAQFWAASAGNAPWVRAGIDQAQTNGLSTIQNAELFALLATGIADATIATWNTKYFYDYWRPITGIRAGDSDGNAGTVGDANWQSLIAAPGHPSYLSAHAAVAGAAASILQSRLGSGDRFCLTAAANTLCWDSFALAAQNAADSRLWGGIHWRFDNEAGLALGRTAAANALADGRLAAVPEPATWTMLILGFGLLGGALRRPRTHIAVTYNR